MRLLPLYILGQQQLSVFFKKQQGKKAEEATTVWETVACPLKTNYITSMESLLHVAEDRVLEISEESL